MLDSKKLSCLSGQITTKGGDVVKFEFSIGEGGKVCLVEAPESTSTLDPAIFKEASGMLGAKMRELLVGGSSLFVQARNYSAQKQGNVENSLADILLSRL